MLQVEVLVGRPGRPDRTADFDDRAEFLRNDYAYVGRLPTGGRRAARTGARWSSTVQPDDGRDGAVGVTERGPD
ncbi:hypothetical protein [Nonomuraea sp. NPDC001699]